MVGAQSGGASTDSNASNNEIHRLHPGCSDNRWATCVQRQPWTHITWTSQPNMSPLPSIYRDGSLPIIKPSPGTA